MIFLKSIQKNEVKNVLLIKNVGGGAWCSYGEHSHDQYELIIQDVRVLVLAPSTLYGQRVSAQ